jgi:hypothetical protein
VARNGSVNQSRQRGHELAAALLEVRLRQARTQAETDHVQGARAGLFNVVGQVERLGQHGIARDRRVLLPEQLRREAVGQLPRIPDLHPVAEDVDLDGRVRGVVPVRHGIDDGLGQDGARDLVADRSRRALVARPHAPRQLGEDEIDRLINQVEERALEQLEGRDRLLDLGPVEVQAFELRSRQPGSPVGVPRPDAGLAAGHGDPQ